MTRTAKDEFHVIELAPGSGSYFSGDWTTSQLGEVKVRIAAVGNPLLAKRVDPALAIIGIALVQKQLPKARFVRVRASYTVDT